MTELLTAAQMRAIEQAAIDSGEVTGLELMERAGRGVVDAILEWRPELATSAHSALVLCGPGNNGGDGFVVARLLHARGWEVEVFLYGEESRLPPDAARNAKLWRERGQIGRFESFDRAAYFASHITVDALFGGGLSRPLPDGMHAHLWEAYDGDDHSSRPTVIAVDAPSGLCVDSGRLLGWQPIGESPHNYREDFILSASLTVTFHRRRVGHVLGDGPAYCGRLAVVDIGLGKGGWSPVDWNRTWVDRSSARRRGQHSGLAPRGTALGLITRDTPTPSSLASFQKLDGHKYDHGHALVLSGGVGRGGAARLAARGALRVGAGLVTVGCPPAALQENAARLDAIMLRRVAGPEALSEILEDQRINAICVGPGFGVGENCCAAVSAICRAEGRRVVLDADALTSFADDPKELLTLTHEHCVLTPHEGEFGRLFPDILEKLRAPAIRGPAYSKVDATREAAARAGCVVLFKGADTVVADPSGRCSINSAHYERAAPWLATAGSGDVLAGFITGLLARGFPAMAAAETAAWLHVECARKFGPGLIAEDLPEQLPAVFRDLGL